MKQVQIWLEPDQCQVLTEIAQHTDVNFSELLRQIIQDWLTTHAAEAIRRRRLNALKELSLLRVDIEQHSGLIYENLLAAICQEREQDLGRKLGELNALTD
jgi:hypothetical protein